MIELTGQSVLTLENVTLDGNASSTAGRALVNVIADSTLVMNSGTILKNNKSGPTTTSGYTVRVAGTFVMNGGEIKDNSGSWGGAVGLASSTAVFTMTGGSITNFVNTNTGQRDSVAVFSFADMTASTNSAMAINIAPKSDISISGSFETASAYHSIPSPLSVTPVEGFSIASVTMNGVPQASSGGVYPFNLRDIETGLAVTMGGGDPEPTTHSVTFSQEAFEGGAVTITTEHDVVGGVAQAAANEAVTLTVAPSEGYKLNALTVSGTSSSVNVTETETANVYIFTMPDEAVTVTAVFKEDTPTPPEIDVAAGYGGTISISEAGGGQFAVTSTATNYVIDEIWVDGVEVQDVQGLPTYTTILPPTSSIFATFAHTINFSSPVNGTLSVVRGSNASVSSGSIVRDGEFLTITATPATGYELDELLLTGLVLQDDGTYEVLAKQGEATPAISATFKDATPSVSKYTVNFGRLNLINGGTAEDGAGSFTVDKPLAAAGETVTVTSTNPKYVPYYPTMFYINTASASNQKIFTKIDRNTYTFTMPDENVTITGSLFERYAVDTVIDGQGEVSTRGVYSLDDVGFADWGYAVNITNATPDDGYRLVSMSVVKKADGSPITMTSATRFMMPREDVVLYVVFEAISLQGEGTENDPYLITGVDDFRQFANMVNQGMQFSGTYFKLTNDLTLPRSTEADRTWNAVGSYNAGVAFSGTFDGDGHTLTYLADISLFDYLVDARVENLTIAGEVSGLSKGGFACVVTGTTFYNCTNEATVSGRLMGGFVYEAYGTQTHPNLFERCVNKGDVTSDRSGVAGISARSIYTTFRQCVNYGAITATTDSAGAAGITSIGYGTGTQKYVIVEDCYNAGAIKGNTANGIAGWADTIKNCYNSGALTATKDSYEEPISAISQLLSSNSYYLEVEGGYGDKYAMGLSAESLVDAAQLLDGNDRGIWMDDHPGAAGADDESVALGFPRLYWQTPGTGIPGDGSGGDGNTEPPIDLGTLVESITVGVAEDALAAITEPGGTLQLAAVVLPEDATNPEVVWSIVSGSSYASIDATGLLTAKANGSVTVRATAADGSGEFGAKVVVITGQSGEDSGLPVVTVGQTGVAEAGSVRLGEITSAPAAKVEFEPDTDVVVYAIPAPGYYLAQLRYSTDGGATYAALAPDGEDGSYTFTMPDADVNVQADFVSVVWDGTIDVTWYDPADSLYTLRYAAQFEGAAAINNGIFTTYPTAAGTTSEGLVGDLPDYQAYLDTMGVVPDDEVEDGATGTSRLYGEFSATYRLTDSQAGYTRTGPISVITRVVGEPASIVANRGTNSSTGANNKVTTSDWYYGDEDYKGKTILVVADLDFGGRYSGGVWDTSSPLYMSLGGQYAMLPGLGGKTNAYAKIGSSFSGTLDGLGHSFSNIYAERYANTEYGDSSALGIVGRLGCHDGDSVELWPTDPTVRRIVLESGLISARRSVGGIVGKIGKTTGTTKGSPTYSNPIGTGGIVEYCVNKATVRNTDAKGCGGIVGASWNGGLVQFCANLGTIQSTYNCPTGGIVGSNEVQVRNCYNVGAISAGSWSFAMGIGTNNGGGYEITDNYWLTGSAPGGGYYDPGIPYPSVVEFGEGKAIATLTAALLNANSGSNTLWLDNATGINSLDGVSYPVLYFQGGDGISNISYTVTLDHPEHAALSASALNGTMGDTIILTLAPAPGWALDYYTVNGGRISGSSFVLSDNVEVSAVLREVKGLTFSLPASDVYDLVVTKTGTVITDGVAGSVTDSAVIDGDSIYEGDILTYTATIKEGAVAGDDKAYSGTFQFKTLISKDGSTVKTETSLAGITSTSFTLDAAKAALGDTLTIEVIPSVGDKDWVQIADTSWYEDDPAATSYTITTPQQLAGIAKLVNSGTTTFEGVTLTLAGNLSLADPDSGRRVWVPIGTVTRHFSGTLDGAGYTVSDLLIDRTTLYSALIGYAEGAEVRNLSVDGSVTGAQYVAGIVARAEASTITGCTNLATITATGENAGGIVGYAGAGTAISGTTNAGAVVGLYNVGGIAGQLYGSSVEGSFNTGAVKATGSLANSGVGGIAGNVQRTATPGSVSTSRNEGAVSVVSESASSKTAAGGIAGYGNGATLALNVSAAAVAAEAGSAGGIVGAGLTTEVSNSYSRAAVSSVSGAVGGIGGTLGSGSRIKSSYTTSTVNSGAGSGFYGYVGGSLGPNVVYTAVYYLDAQGALPVNGTDEGVSNPVLAATPADAATLKAAFGEGKLGTAFRASRGGLNDGYPLLAWELAEFSALDASIADATLALEGVVPSLDGRDVPDGSVWQTPGAIADLQAAIVAAEAKADDPALTQDEIDAAKASLDEKIAAFESGVTTAVVDRSVLNDKALTTYDLLQRTLYSTDGTDIPENLTWVPTAAHFAFQAAVGQAGVVLNNPVATQHEVDDALVALDDAHKAFEATRASGAKAVVPVDKFALEGKVNAAKIALLNVAASADGKDIVPSKEWATSSDIAALEAAIASAQAVLDNPDATQAEVNAAVSALTAAETNFAKAVKDGSKVIEVAGVDRSTLRDRVSTADAVLAGVTVSTDGTDVVPSKTWAKASDVTALRAALEAAQRILDNPDSTQAEVDAALAAVSAAETAFTQAVQPGNKVIEVEGVNRDALRSKVSAAKVALVGVTVSTDGKDVVPTEKWVTVSAMLAFQTAVANVQVVLDNPGATQAEVDAALTALDNAQKVFEAARASGTKENADPIEVSRAVLKGKVNTARATALDVVASTDGKDVDPTKKWAKSADLAVFQTAVASAQAVLDNPASTQAQIDAALSALTAAETDFAAAVKWGSKPATTTTPITTTPGTTTSTVTRPTTTYSTGTGTTSSGSATSTTSPGTGVTTTSSASSASSTATDTFVDSSGKKVDATYKTGADTPLVYKASRSMADGFKGLSLDGDSAPFADLVKQTDGKSWVGTNATVKEGSTVVTLKPTYLNLLSPGAHTLTLHYSDGKDETATFTVIASAAATGTGAAASLPAVQTPLADLDAGTQSDLFAALAGISWLWPLLAGFLLCLIAIVAGYFFGQVRRRNNEALLQTAVAQVMAAQGVPGAAPQTLQTPTPHQLTQAPPSQAQAPQTPPRGGPSGY
jgi:hypothetical protein